MGRVRMVNPEFFLHEALGKASPHARLLFISLWTQADREGRLRWLPLRIHGEAFPHEPKLSMDKLAAELVKADVLVLYRIGDRTFAQIPGFPKWQRPHKNEAASRCPGPPDIGEPKASQRMANGCRDEGDDGRRRWKTRMTPRESCPGQRRWRWPDRRPRGAGG